jgi:hypothetical protein
MHIFWVEPQADNIPAFGQPLAWRPDDDPYLFI